MNRPPERRAWFTRLRVGTEIAPWLTGALLDRLTHHVHILEMNGESYRLKQAVQVWFEVTTIPSSNCLCLLHLLSQIRG